MNTLQSIALGVTLLCNVMVLFKLSRHKTTIKLELLPTTVYVVESGYTSGWSDCASYSYEAAREIALKQIGIMQAEGGLEFQERKRTNFGYGVIDYWSDGVEYIQISKLNPTGNQ